MCNKINLIKWGVIKHDIIKFLGNYYLSMYFVHGTNIITPCILFWICTNLSSKRFELYCHSPLVDVERSPFLGWCVQWNDEYLAYEMEYLFCYYQMIYWPSGNHGRWEIYPHSHTPLFILVKSDPKNKSKWWKPLKMWGECMSRWIAIDIIVHFGESF